MIIYWLNTKKFCGSISVDNLGNVIKEGTAPCYKWMSGKNFSKMIFYLTIKKLFRSYKKIGEKYD